MPSLLLTDETFLFFWSSVTAPERQPEEPRVPLRPLEAEQPSAPEVPELAPGGRSMIPGTEPIAPTIILPEMTPLQRPGTEEDFLDRLHERVSYGLLATATWLDSFFGDERYDVEDNRSRFKFRYIAFREYEKSMEYRPEINLRLVLPQMRKKTLLMITGDPSEDIETSSSPAVSKGSPLPRPEDRNVTTALQYFFQATERRSYSVRVGAKFYQGTPDFFIAPRARYLWPLDSWAFRFTEEVPWYTDTGWLSRSRFDLERPLPHDLFFRTTLEGVWSEGKHGYPYSLSFILIQPLDRNRAISYEWVNSFQTRPTNELDEELFVLRYRQRFWRDWLYFEVAPQERFPRDRSFQGTPGIMFKLEMIIGDYQPFIY